MQILKEPFIVALIGAALATLISLIDMVVNNYGEVTLDINQGTKQFKVKGGNPLLHTLSGQKIFIPSACGGRGTCGACKVQVTSDIGPIFPTEKPLLTVEEQKTNTRLSCQIKLKSDVNIEIPEELFNVKQFETEIESIKNVTHDIKEIRFKLLSPDTVTFKAGQYVQFEAPPYEKVKETTQRAYSISSVPSDQNRLELLIRLVPGGIVTTYVFNQLQQNAKINLTGPFGDFFMRDTEADMICVAGGSGMAPLKSIIYDMFEKGMTDRHVWYFFGARSKKDLFYTEELKELESKWPNFHYIPALSEPAPEDNWEGATGLITNVLDDYLKNKVAPDHTREGYLCGSPGMIAACVDVMTNNKIPEEKIYYDKFA
ncbi:MAG: FAD-binding oxidoreductase [Spirochaetes bacterium]|nr:FAD-binding oxidoreductase [Spirochaetota bacterium]